VSRAAASLRLAPPDAPRVDRDAAFAVASVEDDTALASLEGDWSRLLASTPAAAAFQSFAWVSACRGERSSRRERRLHVLVARSRGRVVGILPGELGPRGDLRLVGHGIGNYLGPVFEPEHQEPVMAAFGEALAGDRRVRLVDLAGLREASPVVSLARSWRWPGWSRPHVVRTASCPFVDLSPGWAAVYGRRKSKQRSSFARRWKALSGRGRLEIVEVSDPAGVTAALPAMFRLFAERWRGRRESSGFAAVRRPLHERAAVALAAAGHVRLSLLTLDGAIVAFSYGARAGAVTTSYVLAHDDAFGAFSPGSLLLLRVLEAAAERGDPEYDFSIGEEEYKRRWADGERGVYRVVAWRRRPAPALVGGARVVGTRAWVAARGVGWLRDLRREGVYAVMRRTFARRARPS